MTTTTTRKPTRRYTLDRSDREYLTETMFPIYLGNLNNNIAKFDELANNGFLDEQSALMMKRQFELQRDRLLDISDKLTNGVEVGGASDDSEDD